jgi:hypothetical protein
MSGTRRDMSGALFNNDRKRNDNEPDMRGNCMIQGAEYELAAWWNESQRDGSQYLSVKIKPQQARDNRDNGGQQRGGYDRGRQGGQQQRGGYDRGGQRGGQRGGYEPPPDDMDDIPY